MTGRVTVVKYVLAAVTELDAETAGATVDGVAGDLRPKCGPAQRRRVQHRERRESGNFHRFYPSESARRLSRSSWNLRWRSPA